MIQKALLPEPEMMKGLFKDYFVLFLPRDIVSGDFIMSSAVTIIYVLQPGTVPGMVFRSSQYSWHKLSE